MKTKLIPLRDEVSDELEEIQRQVKEHGGNISITRLMQDAIQIYVDFYQQQAVEKYSPVYKVQGGD